MRRLVAVVAAVLMLAACGSGVDSGRVTGKIYIPEHDWVYMQPLYTQSCVYNATTKSQSCTQILSGYLPVQERDPECYRLYLIRENDRKTGHVCIDALTYLKTKVGSYYGNGR